jgi:hypothetical protein
MYICSISHSVDFFFTASQIAGRICELFPHLSHALPLSADFRTCFVGVGRLPWLEEREEGEEESEPVTLQYYRTSKTEKSHGFEEAQLWRWGDYEKVCMRIRYISLLMGRLL